MQKQVRPIIIGSNGCFSKSLSRYLGNISLRHEIKELQKTAILSTAHILRKVLTSKYKTSIKGNNTMCTTKSNYRTAATLHTLKHDLFQICKCKCKCSV